MPDSRALMVDMDDTLNAMQREVLRHIARRTGENPGYWAMDADTIEQQRSRENALVQEFLGRPDLVMRGRPYRFALEGVRLLHQAGYRLHIVSSRQEPLHQATEDWLAQYGFRPYIHQIHRRYSMIRGRDFKTRVAAEIGAAVAFDDTPTVVEELVKHGTPVYLIRRPWNRHITPRPALQVFPSFYRAAVAFLENGGEEKT
jgi:hypothetical protein